MTGRKFDSMPAIEDRDEQGYRNYGRRDHAYLLSWYYPARTNGKMESVRRRQIATTERALEFAIKHRPPVDRVPVSLRVKLAKLLRTLEEADVKVELGK